MGQQIKAARPSRRPRVLLIVDTALASGRGILRGILRFAREYGAWLIYHEPRGIGETPPAWLLNWQGDGIIARLQNRRIMRAVLRAGLPAVDVLGVAHDAKVPLVHVDDAAIGRMAADYLLGRGLVSFGFYHMQGVNWSEQRCAAFRKAVARKGYACDVCAVPATWSWDAEQERLADWLRRLPKPAGVMICSDWRGQAVMEACRRTGLRVPDEVAVIGVDNDTVLCEACDPPLSSVVVDYEKVGWEAAACLDRLMVGKAAPQHPIRVGPLRVQARRSTDILAIGEGAVAAAIRLIREQACKGLTASDVARQVPMSRSVLQRRFRQILGRSLHDEIIRTRLAEAQFLLRETDLPIATIAERVGFKHQEYMGAVFKARLGTTPLALRRA
jgi:LacI family transcriptional regulator